jgi:hypothetical protein
MNLLSQRESLQVLFGNCNKLFPRIFLPIHDKKASVQVPFLSAEEAMKLSVDPDPSRNFLAMSVKERKIIFFLLFKIFQSDTSVIICQVTTPSPGFIQVDTLVDFFTKRTTNQSCYS